MTFDPVLTEVVVDGVPLLVDEGATSWGLLVAFASRRGGVSRPPYHELNLALRVGDDPSDVAENRRRAAVAARFRHSDLALARQVHSTDAIEVSPGDTGVLGEADILVSRSAGPVIGILTADCAPVVIAGERGVAIVHAGWRGVVAGAVERGVDAVAPAFAAWIGPSVHDCCYTVGDDVIHAFRRSELPVGHGSVDPSTAAAHVLRRSGVHAIARSEVCTHCSEDYFSYRRDGITGRQGAFAGLIGGNGKTGFRRTG